MIDDFVKNIDEAVIVREYDFEIKDSGSKELSMKY